AIANSDKELKEESISVKSTKPEKVLNTNDAIVKKYTSSGRLVKEPKRLDLLNYNCYSLFTVLGLPLNLLVTKCGTSRQIRKWRMKLVAKYENGLYNLYCQQLNRLKLAINQKRPELANRRGVVFHQDNARPQTSVVIRQKLRELSWEVLMHPLYNPVLAPSDYHLFLALQNCLSYKKLESKEDCKNRLLEFFANKDQDFYKRGIIKLPLKWQQIIQQNDAYLTHIGYSEAC
ncbi:mariner Mos1 transposase, partial [Trichonephila clavipes]